MWNGKNSRYPSICESGILYTYFTCFQVSQPTASLWVYESPDPSIVVSLQIWEANSAALNAVRWNIWRFLLRSFGNSWWTCKQQKHMNKCQQYFFGIRHSVNTTIQSFLTFGHGPLGMNYWIKLTAVKLKDLFRVASLLCSHSWIPFTFIDSSPLSQQDFGKFLGDPFAICFLANFMVSLFCLSVKGSFSS